MGHAFLSYVKEDIKTVSYVASILRANGVDYWMDVNDLKPGTPWRDQLREAIQGGSFFIPFFSAAWSARERTQANEELVWAIEELRRRPTNRAWFIPVLLDAGTVPDREIGGGLRLSDFQYISIADLGWKAALARLLRALGVSDPILDAGEPLGRGLPSRIKLTDGWFTCDRTEPPIAQLADLEFQLLNGSIERATDGRMIARLQSRAPNTKLQRVNELFGLADIECVSDDQEISQEEGSPTAFTSFRSYMMPKGSIIPPMFGNDEVVLPFDLPVEVTWTARGHLSEDRFIGVFDGELKYPMITARMFGRFALSFSPLIGVT